jgi:hypothetical protein
MAQVDAAPMVRPGAMPALGAAAVLVALATWLVFAGHEILSGTSAALAGLLLVWSGVVVRRNPSPPLVFADASMSLAFDGCLLAAIALTARVSDPPASGAAVAALVTTFLAAYVRARGTALGYSVEEGLASRALRYALIAAGIAGEWPGPTMFAVLALTLLSAGVRTSQVAKKERE